MTSFLLDNRVHRALGSQPPVLVSNFLVGKSYFLEHYLQTEAPRARITWIKDNVQRVVTPSVEGSGPGVMGFLTKPVCSAFLRPSMCLKGSCAVSRGHPA